MDNDVKMKSAKSKSAHGNSFKEAVLNVLKEFKNTGIISTIQMEKKFGQFHVPFLVNVQGNSVAIFTTTSARSDRIKEDQWDAWGIKNTEGKNTRCVLVLPDEISEKEKGNYLKEKDRLLQPNYISMLDDIIQIKELKSYL